MKILFISPNTLIHREFLAKGVSFPLGLGYLASVALSKGHEVKMIDSFLEGIDQSRQHNDTFNEYGLPDDEILKRAAEFRPDFIGISCLYTARWPIVKRLSSKLKQAFPDVLIGTGGIHPTNNPKVTLSAEGIDFVCIGEGELVFKELLDAIEDKQDYSLIKGLGYKLEGQININKEIRYIADLDSIPLPSRHLVQYEKYLQHYNRNGIIATRGCPYHCYYCSALTIMGQSLRTRSVKIIVDEIEFLKKTYKTDFISFDDDNLTFNQDYLLDLCNEIIDRNLNIRWNTPQGVNIHSLTYEGLAKMRESGCFAICIAIESGDPEILEIMNKKVNLEKARQVTEWCRELKILTLGFFILGIPGETMESMQRSRDFAITIALDAINVFIVSPFPGTKLYDDCFEKGYVEAPNYDKLNFFESTINTEYLTADQVKDFQKEFIRSFDSSKRPPFTHKVLLDTVRSPESKEQLEEIRESYFNNF